MKNYPHIISKVYGEPWVITREKHQAIRTLLESRIAEHAGTGNYDSFFKKGIEPPEDYDYPETKRISSTYIIPVYGIIGKHLSGMELMCGGCSLDTVNACLKIAREDAGIQHVILDFDSPGGTVVGVPETAKLIAELAQEKEVTAYSESMCCSGAYWLASQANQFYCTESAIIGSIGVYSVYYDETEALKNEGVKVNAISAGKFKLSGAFFKEMTEEERAMFQERCDNIYRKFKEACLTRRTIPDEEMQGQTYYGEHAVARGLCDGLVDDLEDLISQSR